MKQKDLGIPNDWMPLFEWQKWHYPKQTAFINALKDYWEVVFCAGNGTGKTHILYWNLICYALGIHPYQIASPPLAIKILMIDFEHGLEKIFAETCMAKQFMPDGSEIGSMLPYSAVERLWNRDDRSVKFKNGSMFFFQTSEQKKRLHSGTNFDILACEEEPEYQTYDESKRGMRTARGGGRILHAFTPPFDEEDKRKGPSWTKFKLIDPFEKGLDDDLFVVRAAMADNPAINEDFIRKFSKGKTEEQLRIQLYGDYPTWGELVHGDFQDNIWDSTTKTGHLLPNEFIIPWDDPDTLFECALDWHSSKPPAIVWSFEYLSGPNKGDVVFFDELSPQAGKGMTIMQTSHAMREIEGHRRVRIRRWGDPKMKDKSNELISGFNAWEEFRHCGIRLTEGYNRQPEVGISIVNDFLRGKGNNNREHPRVFIRENCRTLRHNMKNHHWIRKNDGSAVPDPKFSDYCWGVRQILQPKSRKQKKKMERRESKWGLTSYGGDPAFGPYMGAYMNRRYG